MGLTGRYDFSGIQKAAKAGIRLAIAGTGWGAALLASPFYFLVDLVEGLAVNWLANRGLIVFNVGDVLVDGVISEAKLTNALNKAFDKMKVGRENITPAEGAKIDAETTEVFDEFADLPMANGVQHVPDKTI